LCGSETWRLILGKKIFSRFVNNRVLRRRFVSGMEKAIRRLRKLRREELNLLFLTTNIIILRNYEV
jgi:hypothetical protein